MNRKEIILFGLLVSVTGISCTSTKSETLGELIYYGKSRQATAIIQASNPRYLNSKKVNWGDVTPLHLAAKHGYISIARQLIQKGANVDAVDDNQNTPLHLACQYANIRLVELLIQSNANVNALTKFKYSPLHYAHGPRTAGLLLAAGAQIHSKNFAGRTPMHEAAMQGRYAVLEMILQNGGGTNARTSSGLTVLHIAAEKGFVKAVHLLIQHSANVNAQSKGDHPETPLQRCIANSTTQNIKQHARIVEILISKGANANERFSSGHSSSSYKGDTPLHVAARKGHYELVKALVLNGADVNAVDRYHKKRASYLAQRESHQKIYTYLIGLEKKSQ